MLILTMIGFLGQQLGLMLRNDNATTESVSRLIKEKDAELAKEGGVFMYGFRFIDENNEVFNRTDIIRGDFITYTDLWD